MDKLHKICIISHAHLTNNPRVLKEAISLSEAGYNVSVITVLLDKMIYISDITLLKNSKIKYDKSVNLIPGKRNYLKIFIAKIQKKIFEILSKYLHIEFPYLLTYKIKDLLTRARMEDAALYICHNEPGLWIGNKLANENKNVAFDFEDWYSRDYLVPGRPVRLLKKLERDALRNAKYITTTSHAMAEALYNEYGFSMPKVIYNAFSIKEKTETDYDSFEQRNLISLYWFSQTIGPGRGIEKIIEILNLLDYNVSLHLRGKVTDEFRNTLKKLLVSKHDLFFHEPVVPAKIVEVMQEFDIGLSLELNYPPSRDLTVTNKILHYLLGGLPVIASDTSGHREIYNRSEGAVEIINLNEPGKAAAIIDSLIANNQQLKIMRAKASKVSTEFFNWEEQEKVLLSCVGKVLN